MKTIVLAAAAAMLTLSACSSYRYEPCPFAGISNVDVQECKATKSIPNVKKNAKPVKNASWTTPDKTYKTCAYAGIDGVADRSCKAINGVHNIKKTESPALKKAK